MASEAKVLHFPSLDEKMLCHVRIPNVTRVLMQSEDTASGMSHVAVGMQRVAERFDDLAILFEECPEATFVEGTHFLDGNYTFLFEIPRRYRRQLVDMGWDPEEVDVSLSR